jgi:hypothetical protein
MKILFIINFLQVHDGEEDGGQDGAVVGGHAGAEDGEADRTGADLRPINAWIRAEMKFGIEL